MPYMSLFLTRKILQESKNPPPAPESPGQIAPPLALSLQSTFSAASALSAWALRPGTSVQSESGYLPPPASGVAARVTKVQCTSAQSRTHSSSYRLVGNENNYIAPPVCFSVCFLSLNARSAFPGIAMEGLFFISFCRVFQDRTFALRTQKRPKPTRENMMN